LNAVLIDWFTICFSEKTPKDVLYYRYVCFTKFFRGCRCLQRAVGISLGKAIEKVEVLEELYAAGIIPEKVFQE
jgi:hypothetical protein